MVAPCLCVGHKTMINKRSRIESWQANPARLSLSHNILGGLLPVSLYLLCSLSITYQPLFIFFTPHTSYCNFPLSSSIPVSLSLSLFSPPSTFFCPHLSIFFLFSLPMVSMNPIFLYPLLLRSLALCSLSVSFFYLKLIMLFSIYLSFYPAIYLSVLNLKFAKANNS